MLNNETKLSQEEIENTANSIISILETGLFKNEIDVKLCYEHFAHVEQIYNYIKIYNKGDRQLWFIFFFAL